MRNERRRPKRIDEGTGRKIGEKGEINKIDGKRYRNEIRRNTNIYEGVGRKMGD